MSSSFGSENFPLCSKYFKIIKIDMFLSEFHTHNFNNAKMNADNQSVPILINFHPRKKVQIFKQLMERRSFLYFHFQVSIWCSRSQSYKENSNQFGSLPSSFHQSFPSICLIFLRSYEIVICLPSSSLKLTQNSVFSLYDLYFSHIIIDYI